MREGAELLVIAKAPIAGWAKTRMSPPCTLEQAAQIAEASLADTLDTVSRMPQTRVTLVLDGPVGDWLPQGVGVRRQQSGSLDIRLARAFAHMEGPAFLIGMDTPQITSTLLDSCLNTLLEPGIDATIGPTIDGGYWGIGLKQPEPLAFTGVPMSSPCTGRAQRRRLEALGLSVAKLPLLTDVDYFTDALDVAAGIPESRFARACARVAGATPAPNSLSLATGASSREEVAS